MIKLIRKYPRILLFGVLAAMFSGPGQTFLVSLFIPHMREALNLSQGEIASYYSGATLISAIVLPFTGKVFDRANLLWFALVAALLLALGCYLLSICTGIITLCVGFFLVRNLGQGTWTMMSSTTMARTFGALRGKALGLSNVGYPLGEAIFPVLVATWIGSYGWRSGWLFLSGLIIVILIPGTIALLFKNPHVNLHLKPESDRHPDFFEKHERHWTVSEMLRDWRFYVLIVPILIPPAFFTALFFHQVELMKWKGWGIEVISLGFIIFGLCRATVSFITGPLIDRFSAKKLFSLNLVPFIFGLFAFWLGREPFWGLVYLGLSGMTMGLGMTMSGALYAELYGTKSLGSIRGITSCLVVLSTAIAPVSMGFTFDYNINPSIVLFGMVLTLMVGIACSCVISRTASK